MNLSLFSPLAAFTQRQQSLLRHLLAKSDGCTADELALYLGISRSAVDQQLKNLERDSYVEKYQRASTGGRPSYAFRLTSDGIHLFPKHYGMFSNVLLTLIKDKSGDEALQDYMTGLGSSLAQQFKQRITGMDDSARMTQVAQLMQELGYEAEALPESDSEPAEICARNCVYHHLADQHAEVCQLDLALLGDLLGKEVEQTECMVREGSVCRFRIKNEN